MRFGEAIEKALEGKKIASQTDMLADDWYVVE